MATPASAPPLTLDEFRAQYAAKDLPYEYWHGEAVKKSMPTWLHSLLQMILGEMLTRAGYRAGTEPDLRIDPDFEPRPDVAATRYHIPTRYPTERGQIEIVVEVLSPDDKFVDVYSKCADYTGIGIAQVFVADPENEIGYQWEPERRQLNVTDTWTLTNGAALRLEEAWRELRKRAGKE